ncbi:ATP-binding protein [Microtetraspora malaysiensis]|uniref:ATP-binding protein n=1 Tax=Microtetraspora malaysiensis TaxID=161358 RepID=UPI003D8A403B
MAGTDRERVFESFARLDAARCRSRGGSGPGLAIVSDITEASGGTAEAEVSLTGGAGFLVRLPVRERKRERRGIGVSVERDLDRQ